MKFSQESKTGGSVQLEVHSKDLMLELLADTIGEGPTAESVRKQLQERGIESRDKLAACLAIWKKQREIVVGTGVAEEGERPNFIPAQRSALYKKAEESGQTAAAQIALDIEHAMSQPNQSKLNVIRAVADFSIERQRDILNSL